MKNFIIENKNLVILWILCGIALFIFCGHYNNILLDIGREVYYPEKILEGKLLYRDLLCVNGPFSYLFNALLYKIFSPNLSVLYISGIMCSYAVISGIYLISRKFLTEFCSFSLSIFTIVCGICAVHLFNYTMPYSFGILYGTVCAIYSLLSIIRYKEENKSGYLYIASLLGGLSVCNKPEFLIFGLFIIVAALLTRNKRIFLNCLTCFMFVPVVCALILVLQGLNINDFINTCTMLKEFMSTKSISYLYSAQGIYFSPKIIILWLKNIFEALLCTGLMICGFKFLDRNKYIGWGITALGAVLLYFLTTPLIMSYLIPLIIVLMLVFYKKLADNRALIYFIIGAITLSVKSFFVLIPQNYGNYVIPIVLCAFLALLFKIIDNKYKRVFGIFILVCSLNFLVSSVTARLNLTGKISSEKGTIYTYPGNADSTNRLIEVLKKNSAKTAVIYPEGLIINFLGGFDTLKYYDSMIPPYIQTFGEQLFIDKLRENKPGYIVLNNLNMKEFGTGEICDDYALLFRDYLFEDYFAEESISNGLDYIIFAPKRQ